MKLIKKKHFTILSAAKKPIDRDNYEHSASVNRQPQAYSTTIKNNLPFTGMLNDPIISEKNYQPEILTLSGPRISSSFSSVVSSASIGVLRAKMLIVSIASPA